MAFDKGGDPPRREGGVPRRQGQLSERRPGQRPERVQRGGRQLQRHREKGEQRHHPRGYGQAFPERVDRVQMTDPGALTEDPFRRAGGLVPPALFFDSGMRELEDLKEDA